MKSILLFLVLVFSLLNSKETEQKQSILDKQFVRYVPQDIQKKCDGLGQVCKSFYVGYYLLDYRYKIDDSLKYLMEAYENNASKIVDNMEAKPYYLATTIAGLCEQKRDLKCAVKYFKLAINAGNERMICSLGNIYQQQGEVKKAINAVKKGASKGFPQCYTDLGMYYFNYEFGMVDKEMAGKFWKLAYEDNSYGVIENYNLGVYYEYKHDRVKTKHYTLKAALLGEKDAHRYLKTHLQNIVTTKIFLEEALGSKYWDVKKKKDREFSNVYDLYYRLKKMYNEDNRWVEDHKYQDRRWDKNRDNVVKFDKGFSSLILEDKRLILQTKLTSRNRGEVFSDDIELLYKVLFVDLGGVRNVVNLHHELIGRLLQKKSFEYSRKFIVYGYDFVWYAKYDSRTKELNVKIKVL